MGLAGDSGLRAVVEMPAGKGMHRASNTGHAAQASSAARVEAANAPFQAAQAAQMIFAQLGAGMSPWTMPGWSMPPASQGESLLAGNAENDQFTMTGVTWADIFQYVNRDQSQPAASQWRFQREQGRHLRAASALQERNAACWLRRSFYATPDEVCDCWLSRGFCMEGHAHARTHCTYLSG